MKILLSAVSGSRYPEGVSRHAANVVQSLRLYEEVERVDLVIGSWQVDSFESLLSRANPRVNIVIAKTARSSLARNIWYWSGLPNLVRVRGSDVVHLTYPMLIDKAAFTCPLVVSLHDLYPYDIPMNFGYPKVFVNRIILRQCLQSVDRVACVSDSTAQRLKIYFPNVLRKALTIHNCVISPEPSSSSDPIVSLEGAPFLLCVAQHRRNKNLPVAIAVFHLLLQSGDLPEDSRFLVVGRKGPETSRISRLIRQAGLQRQVILLPVLSEPELHWCYAHCELLLATSVTEGFGLSIVEAMLHRRRIVCSDIPAFREAGGSYCDYVSLSSNSVASFAEATRKSLKSRRLSATNSERFSTARAGRAYLGLYTDLLRTAKARIPHSHPQSTHAFERGRP